MADWQRTLILQPEWGQSQENEITIQQMSAVVHQRMLELAPFPDHPEVNGERDDIADMFHGMSLDDTVTVENFDAAMDYLYDWADTKLDDHWNGKKVCWVRTMI